jgi:hypothetical protein
MAPISRHAIHANSGGPQVSRATAAVGGGDAIHANSGGPQGTPRSRPPWPDDSIGFLPTSRWVRMGSNGSRLSSALLVDLELSPPGLRWADGTDVDVSIGSTSDARNPVNNFDIVVAVHRLVQRAHLPALQRRAGRGAKQRGIGGGQGRAPHVLRRVRHSCTAVDLDLLPRFEGHPCIGTPACTGSGTT